MNLKETVGFNALIAEINEMGRTVLLINHNMELAMDISHVVFVFNLWVKIGEGTASVIQETPAVIEAYLGRKR